MIECCSRLVGGVSNMAQPVAAKGPSARPILFTILLYKNGAHGGRIVLKTTKCQAVDVASVRVPAKAAVRELFEDTAGIQRADGLEVIDPNGKIVFRRQVAIEVQPGARPVVSTLDPGGTTSFS
jgi:hypothetical protein